MISLMEQANKEKTLRLSTIPKNSGEVGEHLRQRMVQVLARYLQTDEQIIDSEVEHVYRQQKNYWLDMVQKARDFMQKFNEQEDLGGQQGRLEDIQQDQCQEEEVLMDNG